VRVARERQTDLVVTGPLGSGFLGNCLVGPTVERMVRTSSQPVLMVRRAPRELYRRVLVPVDFSACSGPSVEIAAAVAPDARFVLMHAVEAPFEGSLGVAGIDAAVVEKYRAAARRDAMQRMRELASRARFQDDRWSLRQGVSRPAGMSCCEKRSAGKRRDGFNACALRRCSAMPGSACYPIALDVALKLISKS
jgi:nucleotide-binding universal stress UspA family protein